MTQNNKSFYGQDPYMIQLTKIINSAENVYHLNSTSKEKQTYTNSGILMVVDYTKQQLSELSRAKVIELNANVGKELMLLPYISNRLQFYDSYKLHYEYFPMLNSIVDLLVAMTKQKTLRKYNLKELNRIVGILRYIDDNLINIRKGLGYRYLRLVILLVLSKNPASAGLVSEFILHQFKTN